MKIATNFRKGYGIVSLICALVSLIFVGYDVWLDDARLLKQIAENIQQDFLQDCANAQNYQPNFSLPQQPFLCLAYNQYGSLVQWGDYHFIPSNNVVSLQLKNKTHERLSEKNHYYYNVKQFKNDTTYFVLIPLFVYYPIKNEYLKNHIYAGRYTHLAAQYPQHFRFVLQPADHTINIYDANKHYLFSIELNDTLIFRRQNRSIALGLMIVSFICFLIWLDYWLKIKVSHKWLRFGILAGGLISLRLLMLFLNLPNRYLALELFSPSILALNELTPSLGDLSLNVLLGCMLLEIFRRNFPFDFLALWINKQNNYIKFSIHIIIISLCYFLYIEYTALFAQLVNNSKIYFEFSELASVDSFGLILHLNLAVLLATIFVWQYHLIQLLFSPTDSARKYISATLQFLFIGGIIYAIFYSQINLLSILIYSIGLGLITYLIYRHKRLGDLSIFQVVLLIVLGASVTSLAIHQTILQRLDTNLRLFAQRFANQRDFLVEYAFDEVFENIRHDSALRVGDLFKQGTFSTEAILKVINNHLIFSFKGYDFQVFAFSPELKRLDTQFELMPHILLQQEIARGGTLSRNLYLVRSNRHLNKEIYVGRAWMQVPRLGDVLLQIELIPKSVEVGKLYPQLLLDEQVRKRLSIPTGYSVALYYNGELYQRIDNSPQSFTESANPLVLDSIPTQATLHESQDAYWYIEPQATERTIVVKAPKGSWTDKLMVLSFLFYFYLLLFILLRLLTRPLRFSDWVQSYRYSLGRRIQFILLFLAFLPLASIWFLTSSLFRKIYYNDTNLALQQNLNLVATYLENEDAFLAELSSALEASPSSRDLLNRIGNLLSVDLNVYTYEGKLHSTTRPPIYQSILTSRYINPLALQKIKYQSQPEAILTEQIGTLDYLSGYALIRNDDHKVKAILNIPYLSQQDILDNQIEKFTAYLINIYVLLILLFASVGLFISRGVTRPLEILKKRLEENAPGSTQEPLVWESKDEIGALIASYNQMVSKLAEREKQLAKNERELAWREMARQVAHEIKNPLTPMKLSIQHLQRIFSQTELPPAVEKISKTLLSQIDSLTTIANSFSQFATLPTDTYTQLDLNQMLTEIYQLYVEQEENIHLTLDLPPNTLQIVGDKNQLLRALVNLVKNAIQATPAGGNISISLTETKPQTEILITIADTGTGIPTEIQNKIFEPNFSTKTSGMGLGLAITRRIIENMNGTIWFESEPNVGTTFFIRFVNLPTE